MTARMFHLLALRNDISGFLAQKVGQYDVKTIGKPVKTGFTRISGQHARAPVSHG